MLLQMSLDIFLLFFYYKFITNNILKISIIRSIIYKL